MEGMPVGRHLIINARQSSAKEQERSFPLRIEEETFTMKSSYPVGWIKNLKKVPFFGMPQKTLKNAKIAK
jgi:hypothetical protein